MGLLPHVPHHDGSALHVGSDAPTLGETVPLWLRAPAGQPLDGVWVRSTRDTEPVYTRAVVDRTTEHETWWRADVTVRNPVARYRWLLSGPDVPYGWVNGTGLHGYDVPDAHDFALSTHPAPPAWAQDAIVYQVFPDRFARSAAAADRPVPAWALPAGWDDTVEHQPPLVQRQLFGGDLDGIVEHLDHVAAVGFNTLYLTPFFPATTPHRYDASTFDRVDPLLGGDEALARLVRAAHDRGWRVLGDLTTNHSGWTHEWFLAAQADAGAPERQFYYFDEDGSYEAWYDHPSLPKFRFGPELRRRLLEGPDSVVGRWLGAPYHLDGWRIDVANMTGRRWADDTNLDVARAIRATMLATAPDTLLIAEHCHDASGDLSGEGWHGAMNYAGFLRPVWSWLRAPGYRARFLGVPVDTPRLPGSSSYRTMRAFQAVIPWRALVSSWSLVGSHDTPRVRTATGDAEGVHVAAGLLFTFPGAPMVFAGDEIGGEGVNGEDARRPMPWDRPERWDRVTLQRYTALAGLRAASPALRRGGLRWVWADDDALAYLRESPTQRLLCVAARAPHAPLALPAAQLGLRGEAANVYGGADPLRTGPDGVVATPAEGPGFQVWELV